MLPFKSHRLSKQNPSTRHEKPPFKLLVRGDKKLSVQYRLLLYISEAEG